MASSLQKLLKNPSPSFIITILPTITNPSSILLKPFFVYQNNNPVDLQENPKPTSISPIPTAAHLVNLENDFENPLLFRNHPVLPFALQSDQVPITGFVEDVDLHEEDCVVWADSTKKKRKKKMNKHKYRKLRKLLRRKT